MSGDAAGVSGYLLEDLHGRCGVTLSVLSFFPGQSCGWYVQYRTVMLQYLMVYLSMLVGFVDNDRAGYVNMCVVRHWTHEPRASLK